MTMILQRDAGEAAEVIGTVSNATTLLFVINGITSIVDFFGTNDPAKAVWYPIVTLSTAGGQTSEHDQKVLTAEHVKAVVMQGNPAIFVSGA